MNFFCFCKSKFKGWEEKKKENGKHKLEEVLLRKKRVEIAWNQGKIPLKVFIHTNFYPTCLESSKEHDRTAIIRNRAKEFKEFNE